MAFNSNASITSNTASSSNNNDSWKAQGFLNFYLPSKQGGRKKLGAIPLKASRHNEKQLLAALNESPERMEQVLKLIINALEIEYQSATPADDAGFAI